MRRRGLDAELREHTFFEGMDEEQLRTFAGCAANVRFGAGAAIFQADDPADLFYVIRDGKVALTVGIAGAESVVIQTLGAGDVLGWSWLFPPHRCLFDAVVLEDTRAVSLDGVCLRRKCETDSALGYQLLKRVSAMVVGRLQATRIQLTDMFGA